MGSIINRKKKCYSDHSEILIDFLEKAQIADLLPIAQTNESSVQEELL